MIFASLIYTFVAGFVFGGTTTYAKASGDLDLEVAAYMLLVAAIWPLSIPYALFTR